VVPKLRAKASSIMLYHVLCLKIRQACMKFMNERISSKNTRVALRYWEFERTGHKIKHSQYSRIY